MDYFSSPQREPRLPFHGAIRLLTNQAPWKFLINLKGVNLSKHGLLSVYKPDTASNINSENIQSFLSKEKFYEIQLDNPNEQYCLPPMPAKLVRKEYTERGLELAFSFQKKDLEFECFLNEFQIKFHQNQNRLKISG